MTMLSAQSRAYFETTRRLLAEIINEGLASATVTVCQSTGQQALILADNFESRANPESWLKVSLVPDTYLGLKDGKVISLVRPANLQPPVTIGSNSETRESLDPEEIFNHICPWLSRDADASLLKEIVRELKNSRDNQEKWLEISEHKSLPGFDSPSVDWERTLIFGHPSHPYHRLCFAQAPLKPYSPEDLPGMLSPSLAFVSVPRTDMRVSGLFEETLSPLLKTLEVPRTSPDRLIVACLAQQLPAVKQYFPSVVVVKTVRQCADAQASLRTLTLRPELNFPYHIKLSLACSITSALRTITPWTTIGGPIYTELLERFLPPNLWVFREVAAITGNQTDFNKAKHLSCILRSDLEERARANNEKLILAAALAHHPADADQPYAQILYNLDSQKARQQWFRSYIACLFKLVLPPLLEYGIGLEAHGQNMVARICLQTGEIKGFAVRDFGGIRLHVPTLQQHGVNLDSMPSGSATLTHSLHDVWSKVHHSMLQNHVGFLLSSLGLENDGGWSIVREELSAVLRPGQSSLGQRLYDFFLADTMPFKCFLRMRMEGKYRDYVERELPNVLLTDSPRWEDALATYKPSLHRS